MVECQPIKWYQTKALMPFLQEQAERYGARFDQGAKALIEDYVAAANEVPLLFWSGKSRRLPFCREPQDLDR
ncbi:hypothetical protein M5E89_03760 [Acidaminococcus intestini]|nr:hypothetical protein M5E89_03760 [Acidaminococcus intestini]